MFSVHRVSIDEHLFRESEQKGEENLKNKDIRGLGKEGPEVFNTVTRTLHSPEDTQLFVR